VTGHLKVILLLCSFQVLVGQEQIVEKSDNTYLGRFQFYVTGGTLLFSLSNSYNGEVFVLNNRHLKIGAKLSIGNILVAGFQSDDETYKFKSFGLSLLGGFEAINDIKWGVFVELNLGTINIRRIPVGEPQSPGIPYSYLGFRTYVDRFIIRAGAGYPEWVQMSIGVAL